MKEELKILGFKEYHNKHNDIYYEFDLEGYKIDVRYNYVYFNDYFNSTPLFKYDYEKVKQLIKLLNN